MNSQSNFDPLKKFLSQHVPMPPPSSFQQQQKLYQEILAKTSRKKSLKIPWLKSMVLIPITALLLWVVMPSHQAPQPNLSEAQLSAFLSDSLGEFFQENGQEEEYAFVDYF